MGRIGLLGALLAAMLLAGATHAGARIEAAPLRVLFIGSSGTKSNNLPARVAELASASGRELEYRMVAWSGFSLEDHWSFGAARPALASGAWDVVVLQDGPAVARWEAEHLRTWRGRRVPALRSSRSLQIVNGAPCCPKSLPPTGWRHMRPVPSSSRAGRLGRRRGDAALTSGSTAPTTFIRAVSARMSGRSSCTGPFTTRPCVLVVCTPSVKRRGCRGSCKPRLQRPWVAGFLRAAAAADPRPGSALSCARVQGRPERRPPHFGRPPGLPQLVTPPISSSRARVRSGLRRASRIAQLAERSRSGSLSTSRPRSSVDRAAVS